jgi:hypothetical protein
VAIIVYQASGSLADWLICELDHLTDQVILAYVEATFFSVPGSRSHGIHPHVKW